MTANAAAAALTSFTEPVWTGMATLGEVLAVNGLPPRTLLHAGPPFHSRESVPQPVRNSLIQAIMFEGWADDKDSAAKLFDSGVVPFEPAQDRDCLVPLAGVISESMWMHKVIDLASDRIQYAVINEGLEHCLRVGRMEPGLVEHQRWLHGYFARWLTEKLAANGPIALLPLMAASLREGDDGHSRTVAGSRLVSEELIRSERSEFDLAAVDFLSGSSAFALNLWMAAAALSLRAAEAEAGSDAITRVGGNGRDFGYQTAANPVWTTFAAAPPRGPRAPEHDNLPVLGAVGDSAVLDFFGLGGASLGHAPMTLAGLGDFTPSRVLERPNCLLEVEHPRLPIRTGSSVARILQEGCTPVVLLGMIDARGLAGRLGGGAYEPPLAAFQQGLSAPI